ncbi:two-component system, NtrC family, nitrogen regulation sensor histidine kinase NtrY [Paracoccus isoporae]|uniref:histidine kinase n=1 Tax=Paracoccus isoporae TaxID=591205 RepID=A0A1G7E4Y9_9RHOB|nr:PAS domain-containing sensor histidine kinase [Paracoccus isoporae]SDE58526.1 two-component system, NtrC family, nitrogen regulation sensor histidine kinase NtrY [Paracoccus isoporae]
MAATGLTSIRAHRFADRLARLAARRRSRTVVTLAVVVTAPVLAVLTVIVLMLVGVAGGSRWLSLVLLLDFIYLLLLIGLVLIRLAQIVAGRRHARAGSRLHSRLVGIFALIALVPTVLVALFAGVVINIGLEGWFSDRVREVVTNAQSAAIAYQTEHRDDLTEDATNIAAVLRRAAAANALIEDGDLRLILTDQQSGTQRGLREAYIIDASGAIHARGERSYDFWYVEPTRSQFDQARADGVVLVEDWDQNAFRALVALPPLADRFLYVARDVDGRLLGLLDETRETIGEYRQLEQDRGRVLLEFSLVYLGFALLLIAAAMWMALWFAERLSRPIGRLAEASERVGQGDLDLQIPEADTGDEIQTLGESFNRMTRQLKAQREELVESHRDSEEQRRLFDSVLTSVTAGVIGLDEDGDVDFMNRSAMRMVGVDPARDHDRPLAEVVPEFAPLLDRLTGAVTETVQDEIRLVREGRMDSLLVRVAMRHGTDGGLEGYVVAFDDVTDLVSAQRMAAWGDVARRVAHEIKNPLTPIQLSAERMRRKFAKIAPEGADREAVDSYVDVIIRQTNDLRRIIDEFSRFARMPEPDRRETDVAKLLRDTVLLQRDAVKAELVTDIPDQALRIDCDATMIAQVFTNLIKNAAEAIDALRDDPPEGWHPQIRIEMEACPDSVRIAITDNGPGLPEDRSRLFEPYVTLKPGGTGLGLPIVKKIIEEHGGSLNLTDAPERGALAEIRLPRERNPVRIARKNKEQEDI